jgi:hypothetical protein
LLIFFDIACTLAFLERKITDLAENPIICTSFQKVE